jgi:glycosyltransferase involved in cell wall biosynthesis
MPWAVTTIAVDARAAAEVPAGRGRYVRELLRALDALGSPERYILYCREPAELDLDPARFRWERITARDPLWHALAARRAARAADVFWSTNSYLTAWLTTIPTAVVVFDLIAFVPGAKAQARAARIERATIARALRRAGAILCISEATRRDLVARHPGAAGRTAVTPLAADERFGPKGPDDAAVRARHGLERPFVLAAGTLEPRKNLARLIDAWASLDGTDHDLVIVGPPGWDFAGLVARARAERVRLPGYVSDEELAALYRLCDAFCYPSLYEGFGLPVLEAMRCGAPVVTSNVSSLPEVAGDAAVLVDPRDVSAIRTALARLLADPDERARLSAAGLRRAADFSWERTARATRDVLLGLAQAARTRS